MKGYYLEKIKVYCNHKTCRYGKSEVDENCIYDHPSCCEMIGIPINQYFDEELEEENESYQEENNKNYPNEIWHTLHDDEQKKVEISNFQRFKINGKIKWTDDVDLLEEVNRFFYPNYKEEIH